VTNAKPTKYNGYFFRSKLEAKWAVFFDLLKIPYVYEPEAFICEDGSQYTPDFYLPNAFLRSGKGLYLEIKPLNWESDRDYNNRIASAFGNTESLVLICGEPFDLACEVVAESNEQLSPDNDRPMMLYYCGACEALKADYYFHRKAFCPVCSGPVNGEFFTLPAQTARQFKFKYYELEKA
jgi:hypothetical protein